MAKQSIKQRAQRTNYDAVVVGSGPNGLACGVMLARKGKSVLVLESKDTPGGGCRTAELTLQGFHNDICSAIHPLGIGSPFFRTLPLDQHGLKWIHPPIALAHPLDDGSVAVLDRSIATTAESLGVDKQAYERMIEPITPNWDEFSQILLNPAKRFGNPIRLARFALLAIQSSKRITDHHFRGAQARALFSGLAAHSFLPLEKSPSAAFGFVMAITAHAVGWPFPQGGSQKIPDALSSLLIASGGEILCDAGVENIDELPETKLIFLDITPKQIIQIAGHKLPASYVRKLQAYRYGPGAFKIDYALDAPIPWSQDECKQAGTLHLGGTTEEIAASESAVAQGRVSEKPFVLLAQQSLFDEERAPTGKHTAWAYCHVPNGCTNDMTEFIESQIERYAPGFRDIVLARSVRSPADLENYNANYVGGDINGGEFSWSQLIARPTPAMNPYSTPLKGVYMCSAATPPGGGVHGMCGYYAAVAATGF